MSEGPPAYLYVHDRNMARFETSPVMYWHGPNGESWRLELEPGKLEYHPPTIKLLPPGKEEPHARG